MSELTLEELIGAYEQTVRATLSLAKDCSDHEWNRLTWLPGWTVGDNVAHIAALDRGLAGDPDPVVDLPPGDRTQLQAVMEAGVELRRSWTQQQVIDDLEGVLAKRLLQLQTGGITVDTEISSPIGTSGPFSNVFRVRIFDCWAHEQDIRAALDKPGNLDSAAARITMAQAARAAQGVSKRAGLRANEVVTLIASSPDHYQFDFRGPDDGDKASTGSSATITTDVLGVFRLFAGRGPVGEVPLTIEGDRELASRLLAKLAVTP